MAKVLQINLNQCTVAQDLLPQADIVIISEQYRALSEPRDIHISKKMDVPLPRFTWVKVAGIRLYSC